MTVAVSSALQRLGAHRVGFSSIRDGLVHKAKLRFSPWTRLLPSAVAEMGDLKHSDGKPLTYIYEPPAGIERQNCEFELVPMPIMDARDLASRAKIDVEGFELWEKFIFSRTKYS